MLNIEVNRSAEGVERYFDRELALSDYLMKEPGTWAGHGAERLGLRGPVQRSQFVALLRNENPTTGKRLTARMNTSRQQDGETVSNRQVGYGLAFGVPKSLSIYLAITGDQVADDFSSPREAHKVASVVRERLKAHGAIGAEDHAVKVLRRLDLGPEA